MKKNIIKIEVSARHCHLSKKDAETLFGVGHEFSVYKQLSQPSDFACQETVDIQIGPPAGGKKIEKVRVVGPVRLQTQVEISLTDAIGSGAVPPIRLSGDLQGSSSVVLNGPSGKVELKEGLIIAKRHFHCATDEAKKYKLKNGDTISVEIEGNRAVIFENIPVRVKDNYKSCFHIDTDEGNASGVNKMGEGIIIKK